MGRAGLAMVLAAASLAACSADPGAPVTSLVEADVASLPVTVTATVTEAQLGARSVVAVVTSYRERSAPEAGLTTSLEVITPDGGRHPVWSVEHTEEGGHRAGDFALSDWRPDLHTALLRVQRGGPVPDLVVSYDVTTGETHEVVLPRKAVGAGLQPDGTGVLMTLYATGPQSRPVARDWDGSTTRLHGAASSVSIVSPDGRRVVSPAGVPLGRWWVVDLTANRARSVDVPGTCSQIRWLDDDHILSSCYARGGNQLVAVGLDGSSRRVGPFHPIDNAGRVGVTGDGDLRVVGGRRWFLTWGGRAPGVLTEQEASGRIRRVPGTAGLTYLARAGRGRLLLARGDSSYDRPSINAVLEVLDPATGARDVRVALERRESWSAVVGATEVRPWNP